MPRYAETPEQHRAMMGEALACPRCGSREREWRNVGHSAPSAARVVPLRCGHPWHDEPKEQPCGNCGRRHVGECQSGYDATAFAEVSLTLTREEAEALLEAATSHLQLIGNRSAPADRLRAALEERDG